MLTIMVFGERMVNPIRIHTKSVIDITDKRQALLLAKSIVETCKSVDETIKTVTSACLDMMIEITEPRVQERTPLFYSEN